MKVAKGSRIRKNNYPKLRKAIFEEIKLRDEKNVMRDVDDTMFWSLEKAESLAKDDPVYAKYEGSRWFIQSIIDEYNIYKRKETGSSSMTWPEFLILRRDWIDEERDWLIDNDYVVGNYAEIDCMDDLD